MKRKVNKLQEDYRIRVYLDKSDNKYKSKKYNKIFGFDEMTFRLSKDKKNFYAYYKNRLVMKLTTNDYGFVYRLELSKRLSYLEEYLKTHFYGKEIKIYDDRDDPFID